MAPQFGIHGFDVLDHAFAILVELFRDGFVGDARLIRYDLKTGGAVEHPFGTAESPGGPGEAVFVPSPSGPADESSGWYLGYVYDPASDGSELVIIDASDFAVQPVARINLPQRVPHGFHGNWIGA